VLLAHPERSPTFARDGHRLGRLVALGASAQVTAGSLAGRFGEPVRRTATRMLEAGLVHVVASDAHDAVRRPPGLRAGIEAERERAVGPLPLFPRRVAIGLAAAAVVAAVVAVLVGPSGSPEGPTVAQAAGLSARGATAPPPKRYDGLPVLDREVEGLHFPRWQTRFHWRASGTRVDRLRGRQATTVFYDRSGRRIAYTIVAGEALRVPAGRSSHRGGVAFRTLRSGKRLVVTWRRKGRTCVLSGARVGRHELLALAAWRAGGKLAY
jgi:hypothetical protein